MGATIAPASAQQPAVVDAVVRQAGSTSPVAGATVSARPGTRSCVTRADGSCRLLLTAGAYVLRARAVGFAPADASLEVAPGDSVSVHLALAPRAVPLEEIVSVGTRTAERTASESPVPVDVLSRELLDNTGVLETWDQLQRLVPSLNAPHIPIADNHMRPVTLRGLAPHHVLVLVNGKRRHPSAVLLQGPSVPATAFTDLNAIPANAIERIEVLRDGAAAQYGSDAIGGVVNIVLKSGARAEMQAAAGTVASAEGGRTFDDGGVVSVATTLGRTATNGGHVTVSGAFRDRGGTNRAYPDRRQQYFPGDPRNAATPVVSSHFGNGAGRDVQGFLSAATPISSRVEAYAIAGLADRLGESPDAFFRRPLDPRTVRAIHPDGFLPRIESRILDASALVGVRGDAGGWRWDLSSGWGRNRVAFAVHNSNNTSLGAASPTDFDVGQMAQSQWSSNLDLSRGVSLGGMPLALAAGGELRVDGYRIRAGEPDAWRDGGVRILDGPMAGLPAAVGAQGMNGLRPVDEVSAQRTTGAIYLDVEGRPLSGLSLQAAVRTERFSDVGTTSTGKLAGRLQLTPALALRGSVGTGFRAPGLSQQHFSTTRTVFETAGGVNRVLTVRVFPVNSPEARLMGATPLRPERSLNRSAGLVVDTPGWPLVTVDVYQIDMDDRITLGATVTDTSLIRRFAENGMEGIGGGSYFANAMDVRTRGLDVVINHALQVREGAVLRLIGGYNRTSNEVVRARPTPPELAAFGAVFAGRTARGIIERGQPRETITLTASYATGPLGLTLHNWHAGPTGLYDDVASAADQTVQARWITDLRVAYQLHPRLQAAVSAANLFDVYPDEWNDFKDGLDARGPSMQGIFRHPGALSPFGINGRTLYLQLEYR